MGVLRGGEMPLYIEVKYMLDALKQIGKIVQIQQDDLLCQEGEVGDCLYILLNGAVDVYKTSPLDQEPVVLATLRPGDVFGEMSMIRGGVRNASVVATEPTVALRIERDNFKKFIALEPRYAINMMKTISDRILNTRKRYEAEQAHQAEEETND